MHKKLGRQAFLVGIFWLSAERDIAPSRAMGRDVEISQPGTQPANPVLESDGEVATKSK
jgi:hypothetical protein